MEQITETYEERRAREVKEDQSKQDRFKSILTTMGYTDFKFEAHYPRVNGTKGDFRLYFREGALKGKVSVGGSLPRARDNQYPQVICPQDINISLSKTDERIITEINNRFFPGYTDAVRVAKEQNAKHEAALDSHASTKKKIFALMGDNSRYNSSENDNVSFWRTEINYAGDEITITSRLSIGAALKVLKLIKKLEGQ